MTKHQKILSDTIYFNPKTPSAQINFSQAIHETYTKSIETYKIPILLCIGSDRSTGDCLGPLVGHLLKPYAKHFILYGTLESPVHAGNLSEIIMEIHKNHTNPYIIALDASLGIQKHIGLVTLCNGNLRPGIGVGKILPKVGDTFITGIVNTSTNHPLQTLQSTRLAMVMELASFISEGIIQGIESHHKSISSIHLR